MSRESSKEIEVSDKIGLFFYPVLVDKAGFAIKHLIFYYEKSILPFVVDAPFIFY